MTMCDMKDVAPRRLQFIHLYGAFYDLSVFVFMSQMTKNHMPGICKKYKKQNSSNLVVLDGGGGFRDDIL